MKVIVNSSGFYGGTWYEAKGQAQDMPETVARAFLPPHGDQLALPKAERSAVKPDDRKAG
jgi:hypothetical protein